MGGCGWGCAAGITVRGAAGATGAAGAVGVTGPAAATGKARVNSSDAIISKLKNPTFFMFMRSPPRFQVGRGRINCAAVDRAPAKHRGNQRPPGQPQYSQAGAECWSASVAFLDAP